MQNQIDNQLYDIYPVWHVPFWQTQWFVIGVSALILIVCIAALLLIVRKIKARKLQKSPWDKALMACDSLEKDHMHAYEGKEFYLALTIIIKDYLHRRYGFDVHSKTDEELIAYLNALHFNKELVEQLHAVMQGVVTIKFANAAAMQEQMKRDLATTRLFIKKTIPTAQH